MPIRLWRGCLKEHKTFIHVNGQKEITDAIHMAKELGVNRIVIVGGEDADKVASLLLKNDIPVVINRAHRIQALWMMTTTYPTEMQRY